MPLGGSGQVRIDGQWHASMRHTLRIHKLNNPDFHFGFGRPFCRRDEGQIDLVLCCGLRCGASLRYTDT
jgi:hypothetical protein